MADQAEQAFILACLTHRLYPDRPLPSAPEGLDWEQVHGLLAGHGLMRLFYALGREEAGLWPQSFQRLLRADYVAARLWGDLCAAEVQAALVALHAAGIATLVLKGWALIPTLYGGDPGLRLCGDLDLLVQPVGAERAEQVIQQLGYRAALEQWPGFGRRYRNSRAFFRARQPWPFADSFAVALHWGLLDTPYYYGKIDCGALFQRSEPVYVAGMETRRLSTEDYLVYACGHVALHHDYDESLHRPYELAALILWAGAALDWAAVADHAAQWRLVVPVQRVLGRLGELWPGIVPEGVAGQIAALRATRPERAVHRWVVSERQNHGVRALVAGLTLPGLRRRGRYLLEAAFPGPDYLRRRYGAAPGGAWPLLYLRRFGLAARYAAAAAGHAIGAGWRRRHGRGPNQGRGDV